jgi:hypothetical protein
MIRIFLADPDPNRHQLIGNSDLQIRIYTDGYNLNTFSLFFIFYF